MSVKIDDHECKTDCGQLATSSHQTTTTRQPRPNFPHGHQSVSVAVSWCWCLVGQHKVFETSP